ncbi:MAG: hypothetical protein WCP56_02855 [Candidatus Saccharibacteria bacterium]
MKSYIIIAKFKDGVTADKISELIPAEQKQAEILKDNGLLGEIKVAMPRRTVFIEAFGNDVDIVLENIKTLPMAKLWSIDIYAVTPPSGSPA